jgi:putative phage-type endonuclease
MGFDIMNIEYYPSEEFHERRRLGVGGSDVAAIVGVSRWRTPLEVYMDKKGLAEPIEENEAMKMGKMHEPTIIELYNEKNDYWIDDSSPVGEKAIVKKGEHYYFHPDGFIYDNDKIIGGFEAKTSRVMKDWGFEPHEIPQEYILQCQWGMFVCDLPFFDLAVLLQGVEYRQYRIERDDTVINTLKTAVDAFWRNNVLDSIPPPPTGAKSDSQLLNALYEQTDKQVQADEIALAFIDKLETTRIAIKHLEDEKREAENFLKVAIGEAIELINPSHKITWKKPKDTIKVDWKTIAEKAIRLMTASDSVYKEKLMEYINAHSTVKENARRFNFTPIKKDE